MVKSNFVVLSVITLFIASMLILELGGAQVNSRDERDDDGSVSRSGVIVSDHNFATVPAGEVEELAEIGFAEAVFRVSKEEASTELGESEDTGLYVIETLGEFADVSDFGVYADDGAVASELIGEFVEAEPEQILVLGSADELETIGVYIDVENGVDR